MPTGDTPDGRPCACVTIAMNTRLESAAIRGKRGGLGMTVTFENTGAKVLLTCACAVLLALILAGPAYAASGLAVASDSGDLSTQATSYNVWVGDTQVTSANASNVLGDGGSVKYDANTQTLTLNKAKITKAHVGSSRNGNVIGSGIQYALPSGTFTINVKGSNKITVPTASSEGNIASYTYGISEYSGNKAKLKIKGSGSLVTNAGGASLTSCGLYVTYASAAVQGKVKLTCIGTNATRVSSGIAAVGTSFTIKSSAKVTAKGETGAFYKTPKFSGYAPKVKAGYSAKQIKVSKKKPASSTYTKWTYVKVTKAASKTKAHTSSTKKPAKMKLTKIDVLSGQFLVHWNALSKNCSGYQMQVAESSAFPANETREYAPVTNKKYKGAYAWGLNPGTRYYVRVRAYNTVGGTKIWGAFSNVKSAVAASGSSSLARASLDTQAQAQTLKAGTYVIAGSYIGSTTKSIKVSSDSLTFNTTPTRRGKSKTKELTYGTYTFKTNATTKYIRASDTEKWERKISKATARKELKKGRFINVTITVKDGAAKQVRLYF